MKKILGLDLGTGSIGWALVQEAENDDEKSSIIKLGVRVNPLTVDEMTNFEKGKSITTNAERTLKRSMRRNLQRFKLRRQMLVDILLKNGLITDRTSFSENGNKSTFETYRLRAKAANEKISLEEFGRILLMINKKRGYKSSRKAKSEDEGSLIDGMAVAKRLYDENLTPGQLAFEIVKSGKKYVPEFYRSDLIAELDKVWEMQKLYYPEILNDDFRNQIEGKGKTDISKIFLGRYGIYTADIKGADRRYQAFKLRNDAVKNQLSKEELAYVIADINGNLKSSSGYLGAISDRSKELYFKNITVGQYLMEEISKNPHYSVKNKVFYRQDYLDEFERLWEKQARFHDELTPELKSEIRDVIIFYQRRLRSQKGLISFCEFESREMEINAGGKKRKVLTGNRVCPRSSPLFQEFKIWQTLNNVEISSIREHWKRPLEDEEKSLLAKELTINKQLSSSQVLSLLFPGEKDLLMNYKTLDGNRTISALFEKYSKIIELSGHGEFDFSKIPYDRVIEITRNIFIGLGFNTDILEFNSDTENGNAEKNELYRLWHLLYSYEGDNSATGNAKLIDTISERYGFDREYAKLLADVVFVDDYGNLSAKAIKKILPYLKAGNTYDKACVYAGYRHSKNSLTRDELENKDLGDKLEILPKNSLRNPVVEKILNQMINVINAVIDEYGKPDEIRIELARELKKNAQQRKDMSDSIGKATTEHQKIRDILINEFGLRHVSRNDIIRYKLYEELEFNGYKTLYSNEYIPRERIFSKQFDIEHIIPQSRLFDDSFSNKTLEMRSVNIEKGNATARDYVDGKFGDEGLAQYFARLEILFKNGKISRAKYNKLRMKGSDIPDDFIERDIRDSQYIAKKAKSMLESIVKHVVSTSGSITDRLRQDWQLIDVMKELNWDKYDKAGLTEMVEDDEGRRIKKIKDWTKRNDHRHHAMDALTVAFTKRSHIQYLNNLNARSDRSSGIYGIETKELYRDDRGKLLFKMPMPGFRNEAKKHLESILVSIKAKNKVVTKNINITRRKKGKNQKVQLTPRGQLHNETIYGRRLEYVTKVEKINGSFDFEKIMTVSKKKYRDALMTRLNEFANDPKKAFTGKNSPAKNPVWIDKMHGIHVPEKVKLTFLQPAFTIRKEINPDLRIDKVLDTKVRQILEKRLEEYGGDKRKAFSNLDENPIWLNKEKGISIKRVKISGVANATALREKKDKDGSVILDDAGKAVPVDFVSTSNNHHVAVYRDQNGDLQENVVSFFEASMRANQCIAVIDREYKKDEGWEFLFSMKQNEYFIFPNDETGFNPAEIDLMDEANYQIISPNLYRVQKISTKNYVFNHHLETRAVDGELLKNRKQLSEITYRFIRTPSKLGRIIKTRINHIGKIVSVGEYWS